MQFLGPIQKVASLYPPQIRPSPSQNMSESQYSCIFQEPMNSGKYVYTGLWVTYAWAKSSCVSKIPPVPQKKQILVVSMFLSCWQLTRLFTFWKIPLLSPLLHTTIHSQWQLPISLLFRQIFSFFLSLTVLDIQSSSSREQVSDNLNQTGREKN